MLVAGVDIGSLTTKVVILQDGQVLSSTMLEAVDEGETQAKRALAKGLEAAGLRPDDLECIVATGVGRKAVSFADRQRAPASCLARGVHRLLPSARTAIDVGAETCTVVRINDRGTLDDSAGNERCASGTGVFLDTMAKLMHMTLEEMAERSLQAEGVAEISNMCAIFAEQEVISHVHRDPPTPMNDVIAGIHHSMATRIGGMAKRVGIVLDVAFTGGVARNVGFLRSLEDNLGVRLIVPAEPELVAALGAADAALQEAVGKARAG